MQYLILISIFILFISGIILTILKISRLRQTFLQKLISKKLFDKPYFSTLAIKELAKYILKSEKSRQQEFLSLITSNKTHILFDKIKNPVLQAKVKLMLKGKFSKIADSDNLYKLMYADFCLKMQRVDKGVLLLKSLDDTKLSITQKAHKYLIIAKIALFETDLQTSSEMAGKALKIFQKHNLLFEEASAYFVLGTVYRVSGVFDAADFMLRSAIKIFNIIGAISYEAEALGNLGLLMSVQDRYNEAESYFDRAKKLLQSTNKENICFIECQQAMLALICKNLRKAEQIAYKVLKKYQTKTEAQSFASDVLARVYFVSEKWDKSYLFAMTAAEEYFKQKNYASAFECRYMAAETLFNQKKYNDAEPVLRELIRKEQYHKTCFHIANAYTLLGLIFLQKNDVKRAKTIFNQALKQELYNGRNIGIAIDYANLAETERRCGNRQAFYKHIEMALSYAKDSDEDLYNQLKAVQD